MHVGGFFIDESGDTRSRSELQEEAAHLKAELRTKGWLPGMAAILVAAPSLSFVSLLLTAIQAGLHVILSSTRSLVEVQAGVRIESSWQPRFRFADPGTSLSRPFSHSGARAHAQSLHLGNDRCS